jgi:hypothetical protein
MMDTLRQDLKYAARSLWHTPGFAIAATITLALGIGAIAAMFTLLDAAMFKPLNVPAPHDLVTLYERPRQGTPDAAGGTGRYLRFSYRLTPLNIPQSHDFRCALAGRRFPASNKSTLKSRKFSGSLPGTVIDVSRALIRDRRP